MNRNIHLLDCTLRDGGYITDWHFSKRTMEHIIGSLTVAGIDYIECGYIDPRETEPDKAIFRSVSDITKLLPNESDRINTIYLAMTDCAKIMPGEIEPQNKTGIDGLRVVFYKHQVKEALALCESVKENGYRLFVQPMVTIDYTVSEYEDLINEIEKIKPDAVSIVDSFGYMDAKDFRTYFELLDKRLDAHTIIGVHSHNNMLLSFPVAQDLLNYETDRELIIDASLLGMGRGAGNLNLEVIAEYCNRTLGTRYDTSRILRVLGDEIEPIRKEKTWGYSPYLFLTGKYHCHPNFACFLLETHDVTVAEFEEFVKFIPDDMKTKCRRPGVEKLWQKFCERDKDDRRE